MCSRQLRRWSGGEEWWSSVVTRSIGTMAISNYSPIYRKEMLEQGYSELPLEINVLKKKKTCYTKNDSDNFSKINQITERSPNKSTKLQLGKKELLAEHRNVFWIFRRCAECPALDRPAAVADPCSKKPTVLQAKKRGLDPDILQPKVIIVGAGMAGLSAAYGLAQVGFNNFHIFEATDRLGGRIHSCWLGDVVGELGCPWINHATVANPLYSMAAQENLLKPPLPWRRKPPLNKAAFLASDGRAIETHVTVPAVQLFKKIKSQAYSLFGMDTGKGHGSLLDFVQHRLADEMKAVPQDWQADVARVVWSLVNELKGKFGLNPCHVSSDMLGSSVSMPGGALRVPLGLHGVLAPLLKPINAKCISYCKPVQGIHWHGGSPRATIRFAGGDVLAADYVIVTIPLGVLKCSSATLFTPCLPDSKTNAINRIGFGTINRILLRYSKPFWLPGEGFIHFAWTEKKLMNKDSWTKGVSLMENVPGTYNMMSVTLGHEEAVISENCTDESIAIDLTRLLRTFTGDFSLPYPAGVVRSKWFSDEYFRGSRSCLSVGSTVQDTCELSNPLPSSNKVPILLFAGEATVPGYSGSLLAAHVSGLREAQRVITLTKKYHGPPPCEELE